MRSAIDVKLEHAGDPAEHLEHDTELRRPLLARIRLAERLTLDFLELLERVVILVNPDILPRLKFVGF